MIEVTMLLLLFDILGRCDGKPGTIYAIFNYWGNFLTFIFNLFLPSLWLLYVHLQVYPKLRKMKNLLCILIVINGINIILAILSQFYGWFFYIDADNIYHRGKLFGLPALMTIILIGTAFALTITNRKKIGKKHYSSLAFFPIPPLICIILQIAFYGIALSLNSVALSLFIVFLNIQNRSMYTDYLTGVYNRKKLEAYMKEKISASTKNKTFSAILIDLDNFKMINDTYGHDMGDYALGTAVRLLKSCLKPTDFIARFGGDEFCAILEISNKVKLEATISKINSCVERYNKRGSQPYNLGFSMGYAVYDYRSHMNVEEFQKHIDVLMYKNKRVNKQTNDEWIFNDIMDLPTND